MRPMVLITFSLLLVVKNNSVKFNFQGSLTLSKDIIKILENYKNQSQMLSGGLPQVMPNRRSERRRSMHPSTTDALEDPLTALVKSHKFCHNLSMCESLAVSNFINGYVIRLAHAVETVVNNLNDLSPKFPMLLNRNYSNIYRQVFSLYLGMIQECFTGANENMSFENKVYTWITLFKRISAILQVMGIQFINTQFEDLPQHNNISANKDTLIQKIITATVTVEDKYLIALCEDHEICLEKFYCSNALKSILDQLAPLHDDRLSDFVGEFRDALEETKFYESLNDSTASDLKFVLEHMANRSVERNVSVKAVFLKVNKAVEDFLNKTNSKEKTQDILLFHSILSDIDHFYSKHEKVPFKQFFEDFTTWTKYDGRLKGKMVGLFSEVAVQLSSEYEELVEKLTQEVKAFLKDTINLEE